MSPILVRPVREQLEHDRIIRLLHAKSRRRYDAGMNPGAERNIPVGTGPASVYPDLVLYSLERNRRLEAVVEVETGESVNHLEALAEWAHFARLRTAFHLYVPATMVDVARQLCEDNQIAVTEVWSYHSVGDDVRFTLIHRSKEPVDYEPTPSRSVAPRPVPVKTSGTASRKTTPEKAAAPVKTAPRKAGSAAKPPAKRAVAKRVPAARSAKASTPRAAKAPAARGAKAAAPRRNGTVAKKASRPQKRK